MQFDNVWYHKYIYIFTWNKNLQELFCIILLIFHKWIHRNIKHFAKIKI